MVTLLDMMIHGNLGYEWILTVMILHTITTYYYYSRYKGISHPFTVA